VAAGPAAYGPGGTATFGQPGMPPGGAPSFGSPGLPPGPGHAQPPAPFAQSGPHGFGPAAGPGGPPVVIDVGKTNGRKAIVGSVVAGALGLTALISGIAGAVDGGAGVGAVVIVIGLLLLALPIAMVARKDKIFRPHRLVFEAGGLRWDDPKGAPWAVPWSELAAVSVSKHSPQQMPESVQDKLVGAATDKMLGERAHVRLDIYPADPSFSMRHPEMAHLWERQGVKNGYRLPLGSNVKFIPVIAGAMGRFAPGLYRGVNATEGFMGLS
jgi:hypothetical protein